MTEISKQCTKCRQHKPATSDYFMTNHEKDDGLDGWCLACANTATKQQLAAHRRVTSAPLKVDGKR